MGKRGRQEGNKLVKSGMHDNRTSCSEPGLGRETFWVGFSLPSVTPLNASGRGWRPPGRGWIWARGSEEALRGAGSKARASLDLPTNDIQDVGGNSGNITCQVVQRGRKLARQDGNMGAELPEEADPQKTTLIYLVQ